MDRLEYARKLMKKAKKRMTTFESKGISTHAIRQLEMEMSLIGETNRTKGNTFSLTKKMSEIQLQQAIFSLEKYLSSSTSTYTQYKEKGKKIAQEIGIEKPTVRQQEQFAELLERSDDIIRQEYIYENVSRETLYTLIKNYGGDTMKTKIAQAIEKRQQNIDLSNLLDDIGVDINDLLQEL